MSIIITFRTDLMTMYVNFFFIFVFWCHSEIMHCLLLVAFYLPNVGV